MGCFNMVCGLSGKSIQYGDKCWFFILVPYLHNFKNDNGKIQIGTSTMFSDTFKPVLLPMIGTYDDYGRIENIKQDYAFRFNEKHTKKDPYELIDDITQGNTEFSYAFILDKYVQKAIKYYRSDNEMYPFYVYEKIDWKEKRLNFINESKQFKDFLLLHGDLGHLNLIKSNQEYEYFGYEIEELKSQSFWYYLEKLTAIELAMYGMNKIWLPSQYGGQFSNKKWMMEFLA